MVIYRTVTRMLAALPHLCMEGEYIRNIPRIDSDVLSRYPCQTTCGVVQPGSMPKLLP